jgi:hypothetical protein
MCRHFHEHSLCVISRGNGFADHRAALRTDADAMVRNGSDNSWRFQRIGGDALHRACQPIEVISVQSRQRWQPMLA